MTTTAGPKARLAQVLGAPVVPGGLVNSGGAGLTDPPEPAEIARSLAAAPRWGRRPMWVVVFALVALIVIGGGVLRWRSAPQQSGDAGSEVILTNVSDHGTSAATSGTSSEAATAVGAAEVRVHVAGDVVSPGLVSLPEGARVADAVAAAGGPVPGVTLDTVNLARKVIDGEQVLVGGAAVLPTPSEDATGGAGGVVGATGAVGAAGSGQVNINTATSDELQTLPRVGPATAAKIIEYRTANGPFTSVDQLLDVPGIGERTLANFRDQIRV